MSDYVARLALWLSSAVSMRRLATLLGLILVLAIVVAGCGGDDDKSSDKAVSETTTATKTTSEKAKSDKAAAKKKETAGKDATQDAEQGSGASSGGKPIKTKPGDIRKTVVNNCKRSANSVKGLSDAARQKLAAQCDRATDTEQPSVPKMSREICLDQVASSGLTGAGAEAARKQCEALGK